MSCGLFKVIGKLTYSAYLIHISIIGAYGVSVNNTEVASRDRGAFIFFGIYCLSYAAALIVNLLSELPTFNIEKTILFPQKEKPKENKSPESFLYPSKRSSDDELKLS